MSHVLPVRLAMVDLQRKLSIGKNIVMEGRDIGTVVFPNADIKIYLDEHHILIHDQFLKF